MTVSGVEIGVYNEIIENIDGTSMGGLMFRGADNAKHIIPFALELDDSETGGLFTFDGKTIYYIVNYGSTISNTANYQFTAISGDYVNGRQWNMQDKSSDTWFLTASGAFKKKTIRQATPLQWMG